MFLAQYSPLGAWTLLGLMKNPNRFLFNYKGTEPNWQAQHGD